MLHSLTDLTLSDSELEQLPEEGFNNPFRYTPHPLVKEAAGWVMAMLESWRKLPEDSAYRKLESSFAEGKMLGVLIVSNAIPNEVKNLHFIAAFSGTVRGADGFVTATVEGFVPPIIDLTGPDGYFKTKESEISQLNIKIAQLSGSPLLQNLKANLKKAESERDAEIEEMQSKIRFAKMRRDTIRQEVTDSNILNELTRESQFQKAELKRLKDKWKQEIDRISKGIALAEKEILRLKSLRCRMSDNLQKWIFENAEVHNARGEISSIWNIFDKEGLTPPGGTGDCAAPKLLEYAFRNSLKPLAMGEFWYGRSPETAVRTHGHFYPSCTSKCGPLLGYMMQGIKRLSDESVTPRQPVIIHEDESIVVVEKPSGMPSVPGLDGRASLQEWLSQNNIEIHAVHRLDMDTSGVMIFAKTHQAAVNLRRQFEEHSIRKTYIARLSPTDVDLLVVRDSEPSINLPLSPDYDERPRQKVDFKQGKEAYTGYKIIKENTDGTADLLLYPHTGRTHQLRVHCAHTLGLGRPILGDLLYGSESTSNEESRSTNRLCLHALSITFRHPDTDAPLTFTSSHLTY